MPDRPGGPAHRLSIVIPCYNEARTLERCIARVLAIAEEGLALEVIIVDDGSRDDSHAIAERLAAEHPEIAVHRHTRNMGKGAALRTGFALARGDFVAVQDADLEYDPQELKNLIVPLINDQADVVLGSRFLSSGTHRVLYFWHSLGNRFLTFLSNMFTDLNLTDMETCYKVFRRDVIQGIALQENRFGFEPEIVAKIAQLRLRIFEMGISYYGRTYAEGKKIGVRDGFRALFCILRYNAHKAPVPVQLMLYFFIGGVAALVNLLVFTVLMASQVGTAIAVPTAFAIAAAVNYALCITLLFRHRARWNSATEIILYSVVVILAGAFDLAITSALMGFGLMPIPSKLIATISLFIVNFLGRRFLVFPEPPTGPWQPQQR